MPNICLIEDEQKVAAFISRGLEEHGYKVALAGDGAAATAGGRGGNGADGYRSGVAAVDGRHGGWMLYRSGSDRVCNGGFVYLGARAAGDVEADACGRGGVHVRDCDAAVSVAVLLAERGDARDAVRANRAMHVCGDESDAAADAAACAGAGAGGLPAGAGAALGAAGR